MPRFRCGRVILKKNGELKKITLDSNGGVRYCECDYRNMNFYQIHHRLIKHFELNSRTHISTLYDFRRQRLNYKKYESVGQYIDQHGLSPTTAIIYLCTREIDDDALNNEQESNQEQVHEYTSSSDINYSFKETMDELMKNVHEFLNLIGIDEILRQLFENICVINGYVYLTINQLNEKVQHSNNYLQSLDQHEIQLFMKSLINACDIGQSTATLLQLNKGKFEHIPIFTTITHLFVKLYDNLMDLRNLLLKNIESNNNRSNAASNSSSINCLNNQSHLQQSSFEIQLETDEKDSIEIIEISSSSSSDQELPSSLFQELSTKEIKETSLFRPVLNCFHKLLNLLNLKDLLEIRNKVGSSIGQIKHLRSNTNLFDKNSIFNAQQVISSLKDLFIKMTNEQNHQLDSDLEQEFNRWCNNALKSLNILSTSLDHYPAKIYEKDQRQDLYCVSSSRSSTDKRKTEDRQSSQSNKRK